MKHNDYVDNKVSIIMSCLNTKPEYLDLAVESILNQSYSNFEFVIVNNGGNNLQQLIDYQKKDIRIKVIDNKVTLDLPEALNIAIQNSEGEYIARMDSDDFSMPNRIKEQVEFMEKNQDIHVCSMYAKIFGAEDRIVAYPLVKSREIKASLFCKNEIFHPSIMIRRQFMIDNNLLYPTGYNYSEDFEMWNRCCRLGNMSVIPKVGLCYRIHTSNSSSTGRSVQLTSKKKVLENNLKALNIGKEELEKLLCISEMKRCDNVELDDLYEFVDKILKKNYDVMIYDKKTLSDCLYMNLFKIYVKYRSECSKKRILLLLFKSNYVVYLYKKIYFYVKAYINYMHNYRIVDDKHKKQLSFHLKGV